MRKFLALFLVLFFLSYSLAISQTLPTKTFTLQDAASSGNGADAAVAGYSIAALSILGTAGSDRVVTFSASADATNFATISCRNLSSNAVSTTVTTSGTTLVQFSCPVAGMKKLRAALSGGSAGTVTVVAVVLPEVSYNYSSPLEGHYITTQSESGLPNEVSLGDLTTGLLLNTVSASVSTPSAYVGTSCTNQFPRSLNASGAATCATVSLTADVVNTLPSSKGGTDNASYAVGDLLYASGTTALSKLADVAAGSYLRSGGAVTAPAWSTATLPNTATTGDLLYASASNVYSNLADVAAGSYLRSGGSSTAPVWSTSTLPNTATTGDLLYASASNVYSNLADVTAGSFLRSGGASTAPAWSTVTFPNSATAGDVLYASASNVYSTRIAPRPAISSTRLLPMSTAILPMQQLHKYLLLVVLVWLQPGVVAQRSAVPSIFRLSSICQQVQRLMIAQRRAACSSILVAPVEPILFSQQEIWSCNRVPVALTVIFFLLLVLQL